MSIKVKEHRKNGTVAQGEAIDDNDLSEVDTASDGKRVGRRRKNGKGEYEETERGTQRRGAAVTSERMQEMWHTVRVTPETDELIESVALEVVHGGRPPKYVEDLADATRDMPTRMFRLLVDTRMFHTIDGAAALLGVVDDTLREWQRDHPRFSAAVKIGKKIQETLASSKMAMGIMYPTSMIFTMKNVHHWADRIEATHNFSLQEMLERHQAQARVVDWDATPAHALATAPVPALAPASMPAHVIDTSPRLLNPANDNDADVTNQHPEGAGQ